MEVIRVVFLSILPLFTQPGLHSQSETGHRGFCYGFTAPEDKETNKTVQKNKAAFPLELQHRCVKLTPKSEKNSLHKKQKRNFFPERCFNRDSGLIAKRCVKTN